MNLKTLFHRLKWALKAPYIEHPIAWAVVRKGKVWSVHLFEPTAMSIPSDGYLVPLVAHPDFFPVKGKQK